MFIKRGVCFQQLFPLAEYDMAVCLSWRFSISQGSGAMHARCGGWDL